MRPTADQHPTNADLVAFALGKLNRSAVDWVGEHLSDCPTCRSVVEETPRDDLLNILKCSDPAPAAGKTGPCIAVTDTHSNPSPAASSIDASDVPPALRDHARYRVIRMLGRGGMGVVYQAEHKVMERVVAVKIVSRALLDRPDALERFHREVRAAAKLDHPNIVKAHDAETAGDLQLLAMEYVEGKSLADVLHKKGPLPIANACHYVRQAALGLQHAFEHGMVHRDLKPQNLMLTPKGVVKILDFGLAKLASESARPGGGLTQDNMVMGTPEYMAPEQAISSKTADVRADIYALGCTLYCLLTGRPPFAGETPLAVIVSHSQDAAPPVESLRPDTPPALAALVARCLAKDPADRPQTPKELAGALAPLTKRAARTVSGIERATSLPAPQRPAVRRPHGVALAAVAAAALLATVTAATVIWVKTSAGYVRVEAPDGAEVRVDGEVITAQPYRITVDKKECKLVVLKDGVEIHSESISIKDNGRTIVATLVPAPPAAAPPEPTKPAIAANDLYVPLFNGKDLTGWHVVRGDVNDWQIEQGGIGFTGAYRDHLSVLAGDTEYTDYAVRFEFQADDKALAGFVVRSMPGRPPLEIAGGSIAIAGDKRAGGFYWAQRGDYLSSNPEPQLQPPEKWNRMEIRQHGRRLRVLVNGAQVQNLNLDQIPDRPITRPYLRRAKGTIEFGTYDGAVRMRNIELCDLSNTPPPTDPASPANLGLEQARVVRSLALAG